MANNYSQFSEGMFDSLTEEEVAWIQEFFAYDEGESPSLLDGLQWDDEWSPGFEWNIEKNPNGTKSLWVYAEEYLCSADNLITFLMSFIRKFRPDDIVSFTWADYCSRLRVGEFGGGWAVVSAQEYEMGTTDSAVEEATKKMRAKKEWEMKNGQ